MKKPAIRSGSGRLSARRGRSLEAEVRAILERAAQEPAVGSAEAERFPDWFIRMTRPGIDLDEAIDENRTPKGSEASGSIP